MKRTLTMTAGTRKKPFVPLAALPAYPSDPKAGDLIGNNAMRMQNGSVQARHHAARFVASRWGLVPVDLKILPIVQGLWKAGLDTSFSCEEEEPRTASVTLAAADAARLMQMCSAYLAPDVVHAYRFQAWLVASNLLVKVLIPHHLLTATENVLDRHNRKK